MINYIFDNSFEGFLTLIFDYYTRKPKEIKVFAEKDYQPTMFDETYVVMTDITKAERVYDSLKNKLGSSNYKVIQGVFLSELPESYEKLFFYCCYILDNKANVNANYGNDFVLYVKQISRSVYRENHHNEAFIRFEKINQDLFFAKIEPKYNVIPLLIKHFVKRYTNQSFIIYDVIRKYGIFYDKNSNQVEEIRLDFTPETTTSVNKYIDVDENFYQELWKSYFKSTTITERKNSKLQIQMMPKRFWKNLTEYN